MYSPSTNHGHSLPPSPPLVGCTTFSPPSKELVDLDSNEALNAAGHDDPFPTASALFLGSLPPLPPFTTNSALSLPEQLVTPYAYADADNPFNPFSSKLKSDWEPPRKAQDDPGYLDTGSLLLWIEAVSVADCLSPADLFDINQFVLDQPTSSFASFASRPPLPSYAPTLPEQDFQARLALNSVLDSPLEDFDAFPFDNSSPSDFLTSPLFDNLGLATPGLDFTLSLFPRLAMSNPQYVDRSSGTSNSEGGANEAVDITVKEEDEDEEYVPVRQSSRKRGRKPTGTGERDESGKRVFNGTRTFETPLIPFDAPIQPRHYVLPSTTSRKIIPVAARGVLARRKTSIVVPDEPTSESDLPNEVVEAVASKRMRNTLAARRTRERKAAQLKELVENDAAQKARIVELESTVDELMARLGEGGGA